ncbi:hypothetical protein ABE530_16230 [Brucella sp. TWI559]
MQQTARAFPAIHPKQEMLSARSALIQTIRLVKIARTFDQPVPWKTNNAIV